MDGALQGAAVKARILPLLCLSGCLFTADRVDPSTSSSLTASSPAAFFSLFQQAYESRSIALLSRLMSDDYQFQADAASLSDPTTSVWGKDVEIARHQRMFQAISDVSLQVQWDVSRPVAETTAAETTWTVSNLDMTMSIGDTLYEVSGGADFRLRAVKQSDSTQRYYLVKWTDRN
jgi:hypothetical protein